MTAEDFNKLFRRQLSGSNTWFLVSGATVEQVVASIEPNPVRVIPFGDARWQDDKAITVVQGVRTAQEWEVMFRTFNELRFRNQLVIMAEPNNRISHAMLSRLIHIDLEA